MLEIDRMLVLSTGHLTEETCNSGIGYEKGEYGMFVFVSDEINEDEPADLRACKHFARMNDCRWIMFDRDGPFVGALPTYDW